MAVDAPRAFSDPKYDYYELTQDLGGIVPKGAIFVHDTDDQETGSVAAGCLKLCWKPDGNCYWGNDRGLCGGAVIFHASFIYSDMFKLVKPVSPEHSLIDDAIKIVRDCMIKLEELKEDNKNDQEVL